ncbi:MAG: hypothetical protein KAG56_06065, partial [Sulfurovaceae bacterium]|nr:hypothetical protein [Sulfurovaceae bacterium]
GTDASDITILELGKILPALSHIVSANESAYQAYIDANGNKFSSPATQAEIQSMITVTNAEVVLELAHLDGINAVIDDIVGDTDTTQVTASQINAIEGVMEAKDGIDYSTALDNGTYVDESNPTALEIQAIVDMVNRTIERTGLSTDGYNSVVEDIEGNADQTLATVSQINAIEGVSGARDGVDYFTTLNATSYADNSHPTEVEIQAVIDTVNAGIDRTNAGVDAERAVSEDILGNEDNTLVTVSQINAIEGVSGAKDGADYSTALNNGIYADRNNPTAVEIQSVIDIENANIARILAIVEDILGNEDDITVTVNQINGINGVSRAREGVDYSMALANGIYEDKNNPTALEIQAVIDSKNTNIDRNLNIETIIVENLNTIDNASGVRNGVDYSTALDNGTYVDESYPTRVEIQNIVDMVNANIDRADTNSNGKGAVLEDIEGNEDEVPATSSQINAIEGVSGAIEGVDYSTMLDNGIYIDENNPTELEIQAIIDAKNANIDRVDASLNGKEVVIEDIEGNEDEIPATSSQINAIEGVTGAREEVDYSTVFNSGTYADESNPTVLEIQAIIDTEN